MTQGLLRAIITGACLIMPPLTAPAQPTQPTQPNQPIQAFTALQPLQLVGDSIPQALTTTAGDTTRGRAMVANRQVGLCLLCHTGPFPEERFQGNLAPDLAGAGSRWSAAQLRLRLADAKQLNPQTIMPAYYRIDGLTQVAPAWTGKPIMSAQDLEDVVAFLLTLKN